MFIDEFVHGRQAKQLDFIRLNIGWIASIPPEFFTHSAIDLSEVDRLVVNFGTNTLCHDFGQLLRIRWVESTQFMFQGAGENKKITD